MQCILTTRSGLPQQEANNSALVIPNSAVASFTIRPSIFASATGSERRRKMIDQFPTQRFGHPAASLQSLDFLD